MTDSPPPSDADDRGDQDPPSMDPDVGSILSRLGRGEEVPTEEILARNPRFGEGPSTEVEKRGQGGAATGQDSIPPDRETLGEFRLLRVLGRGGMGVVYEAIQQPLGRRVALKVLRHSRFPDEEANQRFQREASSVSMLSHPGICTVYAAGVHEDTPWLAMRLIDGPTLSGRMRKKGPPTTLPELMQVVELLAGAARALQAAHEAGVVHRDLKPGNLMIDAEGHAVIVDFGLARVEGAELLTLTEAGDIFGTPAYMAPEQVEGRREGMDHRMDIYSLGVCLYEALTGHRPFQEATRESLFRAILEREAANPQRHQPLIAGDLSTIIQTAIAKEPDKRYATAEAFADDLEAHLRGDSIRARRPGRFERARRLVRRHPGTTILIAGLAIALLASGLLGGHLIANQSHIQASKDAESRAALERKLERAYLAYNDHRSDEALVLFNELRKHPEVRAEAEFGRLVSMRIRGDFQKVLDEVDRLPADLRNRIAFRKVRWRAASALELSAPIPMPSADGDVQADPLEEYFIGHELLMNALAGNPESARPAFRAFRRAVISSDRARPLFHYQFAMAAMACRDSEAMELCDAVLRTRWPNSACTWVYSGFLKSGAPMREVHNSGVILESRLDPKHTELLDLDGARYAYEKALQLDPNIATARNNLALVLIQQGDLEAGGEHLERYARDQPEVATPWLNLGVLATKQGNHELALERFDEGLKRDPDHHTILRQKASTLRALKRPEEALEICLLLIEIAPYYDAAHLEMGVALLDLKRIAEAQEAFTKSLDINPRQPLALNNRAYCFIRLGQTEDAIKAYRAALEIEPDHRLAHRNLAQVLVQLERWKEALPHLERVLQITAARDFKMLTLFVGAELKLGKPKRSGHWLTTCRENLEKSNLAPPQRKQALAALDRLEAGVRKALQPDDAQ